ncbi:MAG: hypothetical protein ACOCQX_00520 [Candidatus Nanoarchaeia archaeon]
MIILAVVIVIALVVVVAMGRFPGIGESTSERGAQAYWSTQDIGISSYSVNEGGNATLSLKNNLRNAVTVENVSLNDVNNSEERTLGPGGSTTITLEDDDLDCSAGESFSYPLEITYEDQQSGSSYTMDGDGEQLTGECANPDNSE